MILKEEALMVDIKEYERIVKKYRKALFRYCYYRLNEDRELTEETFDDIIHVLYKKWDTLDRDGNVRSWLYSVADREIKGALRRHKRYYDRCTSLEEAVENGDCEHLEYYDEYFNDSSTPVEEYLERIRSSLPEEYRDVFVYRYVEKKTLTEVSSLTGIPYSSLRLRILRLEKLIRAEIEKIFK